jgi:hypothetical protein
LLVKEAEARAAAEALAAEREQALATAAVEAEGMQQAMNAAVEESKRAIEALESTKRQLSEMDATLSSVTGEHEATLVALRTSLADVEQRLSQAQVDLTSAEARAQAEAEEKARVALEKAQAEDTIRAAQDAAEALKAEQARAVLDAVAAATAAVEARAAEARKQHASTVIGAHRGLVADVMRRMVEREIDRLRRTNGSPDKIRTAVNVFYDTHQALVASALMQPVRVHLAWTESDEDPAVVADRLAASHVEESKRELAAVLQSDPVEETPTALETLLKRWERGRADRVADAVMAMEIDALRSK